MQTTAARWGALAIWLASAPLLALSGSSPSFHPGAIVDVDITLVASDQANLSCSWDRRAWGFACRFRDGGRVEQPDGTLVPTVTSDRKTLLVPGLFTEAEVAARVARDSALPPEAQPRFVVRCRVRVLEQVSGVRVRFAAAGELEPPSKQWLVAPVACQVLPS
ncbi:MAG: hypothetical protein IT377_22280 [Polyangiaceae bacterium]|nr:hypothetical protein [Polyangiaceae bacterium]